MNSTSAAQDSEFGHRGPADEHRHAAGDAAPDDVLGGAPLEQHRVEADVQDDGAQRQGGGQPVDQQPQPERGQHAEHDAEPQGGRRRDRPRHQRAVLGAVHHLVDVAVEVAVQRVGRGGRERAADQGGDDQPQGRDASLGEEHRRERGDQQQLDDARLGQGDVVTDRLADVRGCGCRRLGARLQSGHGVLWCGAGGASLGVGPGAHGRPESTAAPAGGLALDSMRLRSPHGDRLDPVVINAGAPAGRPRSERPGADPAPHKGVVKSRDRPDLHPGGADPYP